MFHRLMQLHESIAVCIFVYVDLDMQSSNTTRYWFSEEVAGHVYILTRSYTLVCTDYWLRGLTRARVVRITPRRIIATIYWWISNEFSSRYVADHKHTFCYEYCNDQTPACSFIRLLMICVEIKCLQNSLWSVVLIGIKKVFMVCNFF